MGGLCFEVVLKHLTRLSRLKFYDLYVKPNSECEKIFGGLSIDLDCGRCLLHRSFLIAKKMRGT